MHMLNLLIWMTLKYETFETTSLGVDKVGPKG